MQFIASNHTQDFEQEVREETEKDFFSISSLTSCSHQFIGETPMLHNRARGHSIHFSIMDIQNPRLLYFKAALFVVSGILAAAGILLIAPNLLVAILLAIAIWSFSRAYYFAFYVVQHYIDPTYRFAGLWSFVRYMSKRSKTHER